MDRGLVIGKGVFSEFSEHYHCLRQESGGIFDMADLVSVKAKGRPWMALAAGSGAPS
jgi:hypothetical protein